MIVLLLLAMIQDAPPIVGEETDIVVIGHRLDRIQVAVGRDDRGKFTCELSLSSGRDRLDALLCRTAAACVRHKAADVQACVNARKPELLADVRKSLSAAQ